MGLGRQADKQSAMLWIGWDSISRSRGHAFNDRLQGILLKHGFDRFVESLYAPFFDDSRGRRSIPPGRYSRMLLIGYFEGLDSERGIEWRCADSLSLREFLLLQPSENVPDHSTLSRMRSRLSLEAHGQIFSYVLGLLVTEGLIKGERLGVEGSTMEANTSLKAIVRHDTGEVYNEMPNRMSKDSGIETPTQDDLIRTDRQRKGKKASNKDWSSPADPELRIAKMNDGRTRLTYKTEHAVDLDLDAIVAAKVHHADQGDATTLRRWKRVEGRTEAQSLELVERRSRGATGGLQQPGADWIENRQSGGVTTDRVAQAQFRALPGPLRRHASNLATRSREHRETMPDSRCWVQSRGIDAQAERSWRASGCGRP
jgi:transposase